MSKSEWLVIAVTFVIGTPMGLMFCGMIIEHFTP